MPKQKGPSLEEMGSIMEKRSSHLNTKLQDLSNQINSLKNQYKTASSFEKESIRRRLQSLITQRKNLENHLKNHLNSQTAVENVIFQTQMAQDTIQSVTALQMSIKTMKKISIKKLDKIVDQLEDFNFTAAEINDTMSSVYDFNFNEEDITDELNELDAEIAMGLDEPAQKPLYMTSSADDELLSLT